MRPILSQYRDPLDEIWLGVANALGLRIVRSDDAYASTDGQGTLTLATQAALDADDSLAQMIFHELCHWLVQGPSSLQQADWGLGNTTDDDHWREHACLRVQAVLCRRWGLSRLFAPTTDFRDTFWDKLGPDPLHDRSELSVRAAILGLARADALPYAPLLSRALAATRAVLDAVALAPPVTAPPHEPTPRAPEVASSAASSNAASDAPPLPSLWPRNPPPAPARHSTFRHATAHVISHTDPTLTCATCAWSYRSQPTAKTLRCRQAKAPTKANEPACERYEPAPDCQACGACCRGAYGAVQVAKRDPFVKLHPHLVRKTSPVFWEVARDGDHCAALHGGELVRHEHELREAAVHCTVYADRPQTCRDFTAQSEHCLVARRRLGFSLG